MSSRKNIAVSVRGLSKSYSIAHEQDKPSTLAETLLQKARHPFRRTTRETFWALKDVSFEIKKGDVVGIIGRNGAGKSTLLKILSRITEPTDGKIDLYGRVGSLLEVGTGFHPELTGRENIYLNGQILGMRKREIDRQFDAIVDFSGVEKFLDTPVKRYSSGMYVRLAFAVAAHLESEILVVDEVLAVGDAEFQRKCLGKMKDVATGGRTVLFVSHQMHAVTSLCQSAIYLKNGSCMYTGHIESAINLYVASFEKGMHSDFDSERRPGTGEYRITDVSTSKEYFSCAEEKVIRFRIDRRSNTAREAWVSVHLFDASGATVFQSDSETNHFRFGPCDRFSGEFRLRSPWLKPGSYRLQMRICNAGVIDTVADALRLNIIDVFPYGITGNIDGVVLPDFEYTAV